MSDNEVVADQVRMPTEPQTGSHETSGFAVSNDSASTHIDALTDLPRPGPEPIRCIDPQGNDVSSERGAGFTMPDHETLLKLYRSMVLARRFDVQTTALTRQGRLATFPSALGQEAAEIGAVTALRDTDWLFPTYRDSIALLTRGVTPSEILTAFRGEWHCGFNQRKYCAASQATPLATQALHAAGFGTAAKLKGEDVVSLAFLGDGSTSEGDTHEAFNFASVWVAKTIFLVQNNGYAISVPFSKQAHVRTLAERALGYGMPGYWVDGNDAAAVYAVVHRAAEDARAGKGPSLIEAKTYRMEAHTNSDDPTRYREREEEAKWAERDPIARLGAYLTTQGVLTEELETEIRDEAEALATATRDAMNETITPDPLELFEHVYATERTQLVEQREALAAELAQESDQQDQQEDAR